MKAAASSGIRAGDERVFDLIVYSVAALLLVIVIYPLIFVISASFSDPTQVIDGKVWLLPRGFTLQPYLKVIEDDSIWRGYVNTILYTVAGTLINVVLTILAAFPLSQKDLPGQKLMMLLITITMFFSGGLIPTYLLVKSLGMNNTMWAMIVPGAIATYNLIVMRTFFQNGIPYELQESAWLEGCSNFRLLLNIVIPLSKPIIAVMVLFYGVGHWNAYFNALIYLKDRNLFPLQLIMREILILNQSDDMGLQGAGMAERVLMAESIKYSVIIVSSLPVLVLYPFVQKYFVQGVMIGSIKG